MLALCYNAAMKFQCINGLSYTQNSEFILNALLECVLPVYTHCILSVLSISTFINSMFAFLLQELDMLQYIYYIISHALSAPKTNALMNQHANIANYSVL